MSQVYTNSRYLVEYSIDEGIPRYFVVDSAEDFDHAMEQCDDAYASEGAVQILRVEKCVLEWWLDEDDEGQWVGREYPMPGG